MIDTQENPYTNFINWAVLQGYKTDVAAFGGWCLWDDQKMRSVSIYNEEEKSIYEEQPNIRNWCEDYAIKLSDWDFIYRFNTHDMLWHCTLEKSGSTGTGESRTIAVMNAIMDRTK